MRITTWTISFAVLLVSSSIGRATTVSATRKIRPLVLSLGFLTNPEYRGRSSLSTSIFLQARAGGRNRALKGAERRALRKVQRARRKASALPNALTTPLGLVGQTLTPSLKVKLAMIAATVLTEQQMVGTVTKEELVFVLLNEIS